MTGNPPARPALDIVDCPAALHILKQLHSDIAHSIAGHCTKPLSIASLTAEAQALIAEALGEGEIRAELDGNDLLPQAVVSETALTGVWRWQLFDATGALLEDALEPGHCPALLHERPFQTATPRIDWPHESSDESMDGVAVLAELASHLDNLPDTASCGQVKAAGLDINSTTRETLSLVTPDATMAATKAATSGAIGQAAHCINPHCINLSMLPQSPAAMALIERCLGRGPARMVNSGYGRCQIEATAVRPIWRLRHFSNTGQLLLDSVEICPVPTAVLATAADLTDSHARLGKLLATLDGDS